MNPCVAAAGIEMQLDSRLGAYIGRGDASRFAALNHLFASLTYPRDGSVLSALSITHEHGGGGCASHVDSQPSPYRLNSGSIAFVEMRQLYIFC